MGDRWMVRSDKGGRGEVGCQNIYRSVDSRESGSQGSLPRPSVATKLRWGGGNAESIKESSAPGRCCLKGVGVGGRGAMADTERHSGYWRVWEHPEGKYRPANPCTRRSRLPSTAPEAGPNNVG